MNCPACNAPLHKQKQYNNLSKVFQCSDCDAVYGTCSPGESYAIVKNSFSPKEVPAEQTRYYDFDVLGTTGIFRRHGWFDPATGLITQTG